MPFLGTTGGGSVKQYGGQANLGYFIKNSLRIRASAGGYLNRTFSSGDQQKFTLSLWVKRGNSSTNRIFTCGSSGTSYFQFRFDSDDKLLISSENPSLLLNLGTSQLFRDYSAWYHLVLAIDTTQATASNRVRLYVNGTEATSFSPSTYPTQNTNLLVNSNIAHYIGELSYALTNGYDGYMAEINFVNAQQLTPSSFGKTDNGTGQWIPKKYLSTYGTNGFYLKFADTSAATAAAIGKDSSSNGNNWTPNNISVTAGVTYDAMTDSPTRSAAASNYATLNPLVGTAGRTYSDGNLKYSYANNWQKPTYSTIGTTTTLIYCELTNQSPTNVTEFAIVDSAFTAAFNGADTTNGSTTNTLRVSNNAVTFYAAVGGTASIYKNGSTVATGLTTAGNNDIIMMAFDPTTGKIWFGVNGVWHNSGNPAAGTNASYTWTGGTGPYFVAVGEENGGTATINFGQRPFTYTLPAGFKSLNTFNLP